MTESPVITGPVWEPAVLIRPQTKEIIYPQPHVPVGRLIPAPMPLRPVRVNILSCIHRGEEIERQRCAPCGGRAQIKVLACAIHQRCTFETEIVGAKLCLQCGERQEPEFLPGITDPAPLGRIGTDNENISGLWEMMQRSFALPIKTAGDGVVYIGGGRYWPMIAVGIKMLRATGSTIPVKVYHRGAAEPIHASDLAGLGDVEVIDGTALPHKARIYGAFEAKTLAITHCGFRRVLYLDADAYVVADPAPLFDLATQYRFVYWRNQEFYSTHPEKRPQWHRTGLNNDVLNVPVLQGGHLVFDRLVAWRELVLTHWMNMHADYWYRVSGTHDETCFRLALVATGERYLPLDCKFQLRSNGSFLAFTPYYNGKPIIVHRTQSKWFPDKPPEYAATLPSEQQAWKFLQETLRR